MQLRKPPHLKCPWDNTNMKSQILYMSTHSIHFQPPHANQVWKEERNTQLSRKDKTYTKPWVKEALSSGFDHIFVAALVDRDTEESSKVILMARGCCLDREGYILIFTLEGSLSSQNWQHFGKSLKNVQHLFQKSGRGEGVKGRSENLWKFINFWGDRRPFNNLMSRMCLAILEHLCLPLAPGMKLQLLRSWSSK